MALCFSRWEERKSSNRCCAKLARGSKSPSLSNGYYEDKFGNKVTQKMNVELPNGVTVRKGRQGILAERYGAGYVQKDVPNDEGYGDARIIRKQSSNRKRKRKEPKEMLDMCGQCKRERSHKEKHAIHQPRTDCCLTKLLSQQADFKEQLNMLEEVIEKAGHICLFLPKFHCELNPIEMLWGYVKRYIPPPFFVFFCSHTALFSQKNPQRGVGLPPTV